MSENQNSRPPPRRFLVLGANGFIGRGVAEVLVRNPASGEVVRHLHRNVGPGRGEGIRTLDLITASDADLTGLWDEVHPQVVVNCVGATAGDDVTFQELNVDLVARLVHSLGGREGTRLIQLGSAAEYGIGEPGRPVVESDRCEPVGAYGRSKLAATNLVLEAASRGDIDGTVLRVFNPIGPGAPGTTLLGRATDAIVHALHEHEAAVEFGPLSSYRDYIDVRDVAWAVVASGGSTSARGGLFNVARGFAVQSRLLVKMLARAAGYEGPIIESEAQPLRSGGLVWQQADIGAARDVLSWTPRFSLADAIVSLWNDRLEACGN